MSRSLLVHVFMFYKQDYQIFITNSGLFVGVENNFTKRIRADFVSLTMLK